MSERVAACYDPASHMTRFTLILPAAGNSSRFGSNKLLASLGGETVFARTLAAFADHPSLAGVIVASQHPNVLQQAAVKVVARIEARGVPVIFVAGGDSRAQSVANAANAANPDVEFLAIHDAARPLVTRGLIDRALESAATYGAAAPAMPLTLTVKQTEGPLPSRVLRTIPRQTLWALQTPQVVRRSTLIEAIAGCPVPLAQVTDDLQLIELAGGETFLIPGEERNLKLTTAGDLSLAELLLKQGEA